MRRLAATAGSLFPIALAVAVALGLSACGGSTSNRSDASAGQQIRNLRQAYESGAITREEYERERRRILGDT